MAAYRKNRRVFPEKFDPRTKCLLKQKAAASVLSNLRSDYSQNFQCDSDILSALPFIILHRIIYTMGAKFSSQGKIYNPAKKFFTKSPKIFRSKSEKNIKIIFSRSHIVSSESSSGHVESNFDNHAEKFSPKAPKIFDKSPKPNIKLHFFTKVFSFLNMFLWIVANLP